MKDPSMTQLPEDLTFDAAGLIPAVCQDDASGDVLMLGYMNTEALARTLDSGDVWFFSRSREQLWHKGASSGNFLRVVSVTADCDRDTVLVRVDPEGPTCHTGARTCFHHPLHA